MLLFNTFWLQNKTEEHTSYPKFGYMFVPYIVEARIKINLFLLNNHFMKKKELLTRHRAKNDNRPYGAFIMLLFFALFLNAQNIYSQGKTITGTVKDEAGEPLPGASIFVKGTTIGTGTNFDGNYSLSVPSDSATLVFSYVGFITIEQSIDGKSVINVALKEDAESLDEVVVVGYGTQRRSDLTGSVASVTAKDIGVTPVPSFDLALQGRAAGVQITSNSAEPGGSTSIRIRGSNSVLGNNEPLIVLDGYPLPQGGEASDGSAGHSQASNPLNFINPSEIKSIDILKDASATAIYGSRGANGVIIVTTKRGSEGKPIITVTTETGISKIPEFPELLDGPTFATFWNETDIVEGNTPSYNGVDRPLPEDLPTTNWLDQILRDGYNTSVQFTVAGGSKNTRYFLSTNYLENEGIVNYTKYQRGNVRLNLDTKISDRFSIKASINYTRTKNNRSSNGTGVITASGPIFAAYKVNPTYPEDQEYDESLDDVSIFQNPITELRDKRDETYNENSIISLQAKYNLLQGLDFNVTTGTTSRDSRRELFWPKTTNVGRFVNSRAVYNNYEYQDMLLETFLTYNKNLGQNKSHNLNLTGGYSFQDNTERRLNTRVEDFPTDALATDAIGLGLNAFLPTSSKIKRSLASFYFRSNYNYKGKYFLTFSGRADGSSVFAANKKWGFFPSGAVGWTVSKEGFFEGITPVVSNLKFRASYGITGTQSIPALRSLTLLGQSNAVINNQLQAGLAPIQLANPDLEWEKTSQFNIGMDLAFLNGRIYSTFDYYEKITDDLLLDFPLPNSAGFGSIVANAGSIDNKGYEISLGAHIIESEKFSWNTNMNYSSNTSTVLSLGDDDADVYGPAPASNIANESSNIMRVGEAFGALYGYNVVGLIQESDFDSNGDATIPLNAGYDELGSYKFEDLNGDGIITAADRQIIGDPTPDFIFGWNNDFTMGDFSLSVFIQGVIGNDIMNVDRLFLASGRSKDNSLLSWYNNRYTATNQTNDPRYPAFNQQVNLQPNSAIVEDGSYVRLKNVSLNYNVPVKDSKVFNKVRMYLTATNLVTISDYSGFDPEVNILGGNNIGQGVDFASYPRSKTFTLGLELGF
jgi:TonB-linked SusC/RagA family outer membrane protein